jgi:hypothetical protein
MCLSIVDGPYTQIVGPKRRLLKRFPGSVCEELQVLSQNPEAVVAASGE